MTISVENCLLRGRCAQRLLCLLLPICALLLTGCITSSKDASSTLQAVQSVVAGTYRSNVHPGMSGGGLTVTFARQADGYVAVEADGRVDEKSFTRFLRPRGETDWLVIQRPENGGYSYAFAKVAPNGREVSAYMLAPGLLRHLPRDLAGQISVSGQTEIGRVNQPEQTAAFLDDLLRRGPPMQLLQSYVLVDEGRPKWLLPLAEGSVVLGLFGLYRWRTRRSAREAA